jgi:uncharacterized protein
MALVTGSLVAMLWGIQRQLIYFPDASGVPPAGQVHRNARDITLHTADGLSLGAWFVPADAHRAGEPMAVLVAPATAATARIGRAWRTS